MTDVHPVDVPPFVARHCLVDLDSSDGVGAVGWRYASIWFACHVVLF
jgi:hypothetical protein